MNVPKTNTHGTGGKYSLTNTTGYSEKKGASGVAHVAIFAGFLYKYATFNIIWS